MNRPSEKARNGVEGAVVVVARSVCGGHEHTATLQKRMAWSLQPPTRGSYALQTKWHYPSLHSTFTYSFKVLEHKVRSRRLQGDHHDVLVEFNSIQVTLFDPMHSI